MCPRWHRFENFLDDLGECPDGLTLDRIDNNGNYEPDNCRWTTWQQQYVNRRSNKGELHGNAKLTPDQVLNIRRLAREGVPHGWLATRFGVSRANIGYIVRRRAWQHVHAAAEIDGRDIGQ